MKKVFIYVGHSNWGKSYALKIITGNSSRVKYTKINNKHIFVRKMSNDDNSDGLLNFVKTIPTRSEENFIIAYCPNQDGQNTSQKILDHLSNKCELYFFVQQEKFNNSSKIITPHEMVTLRKIAKQIEILHGQNPDTFRAAEFENFIKKYI